MLGAYSAHIIELSNLSQFITNREFEALLHLQAAGDAYALGSSHRLNQATIERQTDFNWPKPRKSKYEESLALFGEQIGSFQNARA